MAYWVFDGHGGRKRLWEVLKYVFNEGRRYVCVCKGGREDMALIQTSIQKPFAFYHYNYILYKGHRNDYLGSHECFSC